MLQVVWAQILGIKTEDFLFDDKTKTGNMWEDSSEEKPETLWDTAAWLICQYSKGLRDKDGLQR